MTRGWIAIACAWIAACGAQAGDQYLGEPLFQMRGQVLTNKLTVTQPIEPALCFVEHLPRGELNIEALPADVRAVFSNTRFGGGIMQAHVMDVEVQGSFPAEFNVNVYTPPPSATIKPLFPGEPNVALGFVCAVQEEHAAIANGVTGIGVGSCELDNGPCEQTNVVMTDDGSRYYAEQASCPTGELSADCSVTRSGEIGLLSETGGFEHVVAGVWNPELIYLAAPAPAGSYTAYKYGAREGLPAGYHLLEQPVEITGEAEVRQWGEAMTAARERALEEANAAHGTDYADALDSFNGSGFDEVAAEFNETYERAHARFEMELVPMRVRTEVSPSDAGLTLELQEDPESFWSFLIPRADEGSGG